MVTVLPLSAPVVGNVHREDHAVGIRPTGKVKIPGPEEFIGNAKREYLAETAGKRASCRAQGKVASRRETTCVGSA
jgi:hypothetical protein